MVTFLSLPERQKKELLLISRRGDGFGLEIRKRLFFCYFVSPIFL